MTENIYNTWDILTWKFPLDNKTVQLYAVSVYNNPKKSWAEFFTDIKICTNAIPKALDHFIENGITNKKLRKTLNYFIVLGNVFPNEALARILFCTCSEHQYSHLKSILLFMKRLPDIIPEAPISTIKTHPELDKHLLTI